MVSRLIAAGLLAEEKPLAAHAAGRPATGLNLRAGAMTAIGVEITSPRSSVILVDVHGEILEQRVVAFAGKPERFLDRLAREIRAAAASHESRQVLGVGISLPGTIDKTAGIVLGAERIGWRGVEAGKRLRRHLEWPLFFENDANLSALAEQWYAPADQPAPRYFVYIRVQDGLGSGVIVEGRILHGFSSAGSELGHIMLYPDGRLCNCGNSGCWEQYASDAALVRAYHELAGVNGASSGVLDESHRIVKLARAGDAPALEALRTTARYLGLGFVSVIAALNPQAIIIGEPIASAWDLVRDVLEAELRRRIPPYYLEGFHLRPSRMDTQSALRGAAALALSQFFTRFDQSPDAAGKGIFMEAHT